MGHLCAPFIWIDSLVQCGVDAAAFFLMRRGIPKSRICYAVMAVIIMCIMSITADLFREGRGGMAALLTCVIFVLLLIMHSRLNDARKDEEAGHMYSEFDRLNMNPVCKTLWWILLPGCIIDAIHNGINFEKLMDLVTSISFLLHYYLAKTPNMPPPQEDTVLVPAKQSA